MIKDMIFPPRCPFCEDIVAKLGMACRECREKLPYIKEPSCKRCGKPIWDEETEYCEYCRGRSFYYQCGKSVWTYNHLMAESIARFKYHSKQEYAVFYGREIAAVYGDWVREKCIEALIPVPIHRRRKLLRGYNQADLVAQTIAEELELPLLSKALTRVRETKAQKELTQAERRRNMEAAFACDPREPVHYKRVVLIDDIYTTGSTIEACSRELLKNGIEEVYFLCVCTGASI